MSRRAILAVACGVVVLVIGAVLIARPGGLNRYVSNEAFGPFYCAGQAVLRGADPYRIEPLHTCEHGLPWFKSTPEYFVEPAPLPPYALAPLALLARLPYGAASFVWFVALLSALGATVYAVFRLTSLPLAAVVAGFAATAGYQNIYYGELPPVVIGSLSIAALLVANRRYALAGIVACVSLVEPHVGLAAVLSMFLWLPRCRIALAVAACVFGALGIVALGPGASQEYLAHVLPAQALAELPASDQFGVAWMLHSLGAPDALALGLAGAIFAVTLALGVVLAGLVSRAWSFEPAVVLLPLVAVLLGSPYLHDIQIASALPAAFLLTARSPSRFGPAVLALLLLSVGWQETSVPVRVLVPLSAAALAVLTFTLLPGSTLRRAAFAAGTAAAYLVLFGAIARLPAAPFNPPANAPAYVAPSGANPLASQAWGAWVRSKTQSSTVSWRTLAGKAPLWSGLVLLLIASFSAASVGATTMTLARSTNRAELQHG